jgi:hypothetical protein
MIHPNASSRPSTVDRMLSAPSSDAPAATLDRELQGIASRFDRATAEIAALVMEYPWQGGR